MEHQTLTVLDTHPVLLAILEANFSMANDWEEAELNRIFDTHPEPLFLVSDIRQLKLSFDDLIAAVNMGSRGETPVWQHPRVRGVYFVSDSTLIKMAAAGLNTPAFGHVKSKVVGSVEEALADIERIIAAG